jgi:hypothetical protein
MPVPPYLDEAFELLRRAYPSGVPAADYESLLLVAAEELSEGNLGIVIAELTGGDPVVVVNDAAATHSVRRPGEVDLQRVRTHLAANGWPQALSPE